MARLLVWILFFLPFLTVSAQERAFQLWNQNAIAVNISEKTALGVSEKIHYTPKNNSIDLKFADITLDHKITDWFELGTGGRLLWIRKEFGWLEEKRPMLYGDISFGMGNFDWDFSNRIEYRFLNKAEDHFRHRQKTELNFPEIKKLNGIRFFTSIESFFKFHPDKLHLARFYTGLNALQRKHFSLKLYYVLEKNKRTNQWDTIDILGFNMNFNY